MRLIVVLLSLVTAALAQQRSVEPFWPISVWYPAVADVDAMRRDFALIRKAGFNCVTTSIAWREAEPQRGAYNLLNLDRLIAVASEVGLKVQVQVLTEPEPSWTRDSTSALAGQFYAYVRRRVSINPAVIDVRRSVGLIPDTPYRAIVGKGVESMTPRRARLALWSAVVQGSRGFVLIDRDDPVSPDVLALGETVGVITRNPALFVPLQPRKLRPDELTVSGDSKASFHILESNDAIVIVGLNHAAETRKVRVGFPPDIPEAIWQNMEDGNAVHFVMRSTGPFLEHTFGPEDALVLAIRKKLR